MKPQDFITEDIANDAHEMHQDHEVQMARSDCYNAAKYAIELHKLLKHVTEQQGLEGWVSEKITLANDYLRTVTEYLRYEQSAAGSGIPEFDPGLAQTTFEETLGEDWQKVNRHDKTDGLSRKAVKAYRREHPGSKLKTAVTTKPSKLKKGSKASKRRKSFCARMSGMKKHRAGAKTKRDPNSNINKALRHWNCESIEDMRNMIATAEKVIREEREKLEAQKLNEFASAGASSSASVATAPGVGKGKNVGSLFGGSYERKSPFTKKAKK